MYGEAAVLSYSLFKMNTGKTPVVVPMHAKSLEEGNVSGVRCFTAMKRNQSKS